MDLKKYIGNQIKVFRKSTGLTQDELAQKLNTTKQTISRYEKEIAKLIKICFFPYVIFSG